MKTNVLQNKKGIKKVRIYSLWLIGQILSTVNNIKCLIGENLIISY